MALSTFQRVQGLELQPAIIKVGLANRKIARPYRVVENVPIKVNNLSFLMDFFILEMKEYCFTPILLGRMFLAATRANIDVDKKELAKEVGKNTRFLNFRQ